MSYPLGTVSFVEKSSPVGRSIVVIVAAIVGLLVVPGSDARAVSVPGPPQVGYIVTFRAASDVQTFRTRMSGAAVVTDVFDSVFNGVIVNLTYAQALFLRRDPRVLRIEANRMVAASDVPPSWGLDRIDQRSLPLDSSFVHIPSWGQGVDVYVVDTGINRTHSEFTGRVQPGFDVVTPGGNAEDCNGHGTHVSGTVAGSTYGVAPAARLIPVRVLDCLGSGTTAGVISGIDWIIEHHQLGVPAVLNMSLGGTQSASLNEAVERAVADGISVVVAAGNENVDACRRSPASAASAITVGATTSSDQRSSFSNFGSCLDIFAPGSSITSAWVGGSSASNTISGTSMASPHVAGAAAAFLSVWPTATPGVVTQGLVSSTTVGAIGNIGAASPNGLLFVDSAWSPIATPPTTSAPLPTAPPTAAPTTAPIVVPPAPTMPTVPITRPTAPPITRPAPTTTSRPPSRPFTPRIESVVAGDRSVTVSASLSGFSGSTYTTITFTSSPSGRTCTVSVTNSRDNSCTVTGLFNGTSYTFTAVAENAGGSSGTSSRSGTVTPFDPNRIPDRPTNPAASPDRFSSTTIDFAWSAPRDNGAVVTEYRIEYRRNNNYGGTADSRTNSYELKFQTRGNAITFRVKACNSRGSCGLWSDWSSPAIVGG